MDKETFDKAVDFAEETIREQFDRLRGDLSSIRAQAYEGVAYLTASDQPWQNELPDRVLQSLINGSKKSVASWEAVNLLAIAELERTGELRGALQSWTIAVLKDQLLEPEARTRPRPTRRGRDGDNWHARDVAIAEAVRTLVKPPWQLTATRNITRGESCSSEGGSACDAAGMAWNRLSDDRAGLKEVRFRSVVHIWDRCQDLVKNLDFLDSIKNS